MGQAEKTGCFARNEITESSHRNSLRDWMKGLEMRRNAKEGQGKVTLKKKEAFGKWNDVEKPACRQ